ncbi:type II toxin-antitoxin system ParD family antitoxin [Chlorogloeopsis sp. ULAP02]|uniref:type II toxin-antitoxin system ParD family antitoxin n=1 Tax=Chlorogloeopsis sp. ULAP02 TaxID=3107926 RepID=UPI00313616AC
MNITLKPEIEQFIQPQIATGRYAYAEEVISKALKLLEEQDNEYQECVEETRQKVDVAIAELEREEGLDGETVVMQILDRFQKAREAQE